MKVGYVLNGFPFITERWIVNELAELIQQGHDVRIVSLRRSHENIFHKEVSSKNLLAKTHFFHEFSFRTFFSKNVYHNLHFFLKAVLQDISESHLNLRVKIRPNLRTALAYGFLHDRDILHAHFATDSAALAMELSKLLGKPFTFTVHAYDIFLKENSKNKFLKKKIDSAYKVISISEFNKRYLLDLFDINPNKIEVIHMGVRPNQYLHSSRKRGSKQIITLSRLVEKKGLLTLIEAFSLLNNWKIDFHATIVGEGPLRQKLLESIIQYGLSDRVSLSINLVDEQVDSMLAASTMFVLPCKRLENGDMDGIPVGMIEAMAAGLPVVSTNISGIPELVEDGVTGFLVPMENAHELAKAMKKVLDNPRLRKEMGERGVSKIAREFNITTEVRKLVYVWRRILESKKQPEATIISNFEV